jgi:hypothetical protein
MPYGVRPILAWFLPALIRHNTGNIASLDIGNSGGHLTPPLVVIFALMSDTFV